MAITITKITGIGGNPPTHILVSGTASGCEKVDVTVSCSSKRPPAADVIAGQWTQGFENDRGCVCGGQATATASCVSGQLGGDTKTLTINCGPPCCEEITVAIDTDPLPCIPVGGGTVSVQFSATLSPSGCPGGAFFEWKVTNLSLSPPIVLQPFTAGGPTFSYNFPSAATYRVNVRVQQATTCDDPVLTDSITFPINSCCCPEVTLSQPTVTGCAPGSAVASFAVAAVTWQGVCTPVAPTSFEWTLNGPGGKRYQKSTSLPSTDTTAGWTDTGGNPMVVQFSAGGNYSISVTAIIPGVSLPCNPTDTAAFTVSACCPQLIGPLNASQKPGAPCTWLFSAQVSNPNNAAVTFEWSFHDGATAITSLPQVEHTYPIGGITSGMTTVEMKSPGCPTQSLSASVTLVGCFPCPPGQHRDENGICVDDPCPPGQHRDENGNCVDDPCPPGQHRDASGNCVPNSSDWCCFLILAWAVVNLLFGLALYYEVWKYPYGWIGLIIHGAIATILLGLWIAFCCWPCASTFWRCCVFLQWQFIASSWVGLLLSVLVGLCGLSMKFPWLSWLFWACGGTSSVYIAAAYDAYFIALLLILSTFANCGRLPNPFDRRTWPPCNCP